jgi:hypothetical protein
MPASARLAIGPQPLQLRVNLCRRFRRPDRAKPFQDADELQPLTLAQTIRAQCVVGDGVAHDMALRLAQPRGRPPNLGYRGVVE